LAPIAIVYAERGADHGGPSDCRKKLQQGETNLALFNRRRVLLAGVSAVAWGAAPTFAAADGYPERPVKIIVPFAGGGGVDILTRVVGDYLAKRLGEPVVVDDRPGAGGNIGVQAVATAAPDGYTLVMATTGTHAINPSLYKKLPYDPIKDFAPITTIALAPNLLVVNRDLPVKSVSDLIALARSKPGTINFGSFGPGTSNHLSGEMLKHIAKIDIVHVPYRKAPEAITDLIAGRIQMLFVNTPLGLPHVKAGKLRALAVTGSKRSEIVPDLPTMIEAGVPGFVVESWYGLMAPAGTPAAVVTRLHDEVVAILALPDVKATFAVQGVEPFATSPRELTERIKLEMAQWKKIIDIAHVTLN
jgi:tripartite-type tricarboxylate transporter receptor subunit TctC